METLNYLLVNNIHHLVSLSNETPIRDLLTSIHRRTVECDFLIQTVSSKCTNLTDPCFVEKLLRILEIADNSHSGGLVTLLVRKFLLVPHLSLSRLASSLACRRVEFLLTLQPDQVLAQLDKETFSDLMTFLLEKKLARR